MYDLVIIGGGVNGVGIALDAVGRGLSVLLCEQDDLASGTSSKSSKLIHGGLRYLEQYDFKLVRESLKEREILLKKARHLIKPLRFILPYTPALRPKWMIQAGLFIYDHLTHQSLLPHSRRIQLANSESANTLQEIYTTGFEYSDCSVDDARLVILNAIQAKEKGAHILTRTTFINAIRHEKRWDVMLHDKRNNENMTVVAKCLINAAGPWVNQILAKDLVQNMSERAELVKGSHLVVPKFYSGNEAYLLQLQDKRIMFVIPFHHQFCLIGTTDVPFSQDDLTNITVNEDEVQYLCQGVNSYFRKKITPSDCVWQYAGVRALYRDNTNNLSKISREYHILLDNTQAPFITILGGKVTTYRRLAEKTVTLLTPFFPYLKDPWTANEKVPGGDFQGDFLHFLLQLKQDYPHIAPTILERYANAYGTLSNKILGNAKQMLSLGEHIGHGFYEAELAYLKNNEWAQTADDILWRRTKLGLFFNDEEKNRLSVLI